MFCKAICQLVRSNVSAGYFVWMCLLHCPHDELPLMSLLNVQCSNCNDTMYYQNLTVGIVNNNYKKEQQRKKFFRKICGSSGLVRLTQRHSITFFFQGVCRIALIQHHTVIFIIMHNYLVTSKQRQWTRASCDIKGVTGVCEICTSEHLRPSSYM